MARGHVFPISHEKNAPLDPLESMSLVMSDLQNKTDMCTGYDAFAKGGI